MKNLATLKAACDAVIADPKLAAILDPNTGKIIETHCNFGAMRVAHAMGCDELAGLEAEDMFEVMDSNASGKWTKVTGYAATVHALEGGLAFACATAEMLGENHGHIAAVYPATMQWSGSLAKNVPVVANVGVKDVEEKESLAFPPSRGEPNYYAYEV